MVRAMDLGTVAMWTEGEGPVAQTLTFPAPRREAATSRAPSGVPWRRTDDRTGLHPRPECRSVDRLAQPGKLYGRFNRPADQCDAVP